MEVSPKDPSRTFRSLTNNSRLKPRNQTPRELKPNRAFRYPMAPSTICISKSTRARHNGQSFESTWIYRNRWSDSTEPIRLVAFCTRKLGSDTQADFWPHEWRSNLEICGGMGTERCGLSNACAMGYRSILPDPSKRDGSQGIAVDAFYR